jgi:hypothetical protein
MRSTSRLYPPGQRVHGKGPRSSGSLILVGLERKLSYSSRSVDRWALFASSGNSRSHLPLLCWSLWLGPVGATTIPHMFKLLINHALDSVVYVHSLDHVRRGTSIILGQGTILCILWWSGLNLRRGHWARLTLGISLPLDLAWHEGKGRGGKQRSFFWVWAPFLLVTWCISTDGVYIFLTACWLFKGSATVTHNIQVGNPLSSIPVALESDSEVPPQQTVAAFEIERDHDSDTCCCGPVSTAASCRFGTARMTQTGIERTEIIR